MRVGTVCFATKQGLGVLAKSFYDHDIVTDAMVVRHGRRPTHMEWYREGTIELSSLSITPVMHEFIKSVDIMLFFETAFNWKLLELCNLYGKPSVLIPMYECTPRGYDKIPKHIINPSALDQIYYPRGVHIPIPVPDGLWKQRTVARKFLQNAGNLDLKNQKGT